MDTSTNPKFRIVELALAKFKSLRDMKWGFRPNISKNDLDSLYKGIESSLMTLKYSYVSDTELIDHSELKNLLNYANQLSEATQPAFNTKDPNQIVVATIRWCNSIFTQVDKLLAVSSNNELASGVPIKVVNVRNVYKKDKYLVTKVDDEKSNYTVMTNIMTVKTGMKMGVAFLPPREIDSIISEAMYLGDKQYDKEVGTLLSPDDVNIKEANSILFSELKMSKL